MSLVTAFLQSIRQLSTYSKNAVKLGFYTMIGYYIAAIIATLMLTRFANVPSALLVIRGFLEAAPASFVAAFAAALICDIASKQAAKNDE